MQRHLNFKAQPLSLINVFCSEGSPKTQLWSVRELTRVNDVASVLALEHSLPQCGSLRVNEVASVLALEHSLPRCGQPPREPAGPSSSPPHPALTWERLASRIRAGFLSVCLQLWGACPVPRWAARLVGCSTS